MILDFLLKVLFFNNAFNYIFVHCIYIPMFGSNIMHYFEINILKHVDPSFFFPVGI
jgi:hypothetical protein